MGGDVAPNSCWLGLRRPVLVEATAWLYAFEWNNNRQA